MDRDLNAAINRALNFELDGLKVVTHILPGALDTVPIMGWLVGNNSRGSRPAGPRHRLSCGGGGGVLLLTLAKSTENPEKRRLSMQREQRARLELQRFKRIAALERRIFEHAFAAFDQVEQQLGRLVQVQALPAAGQTGEATPTFSKKRASKAISAEFEPLDASQATESEGSSNGHRSFRSAR